jgi:molybdate transport system ATP-binding protein
MASERALDVRVRVAAGRGSGFVLDAAFEAPPGITILFGPSGSGKTTTLATIAGLVRPDAGRVALGTDVWFDSARGVSVAISRRRVSYVFQSLALFPHMTAAHNVEYGIARDVPRTARRDLAREMLARMRVDHLADRKPRTFSGGEAQRVALARAFARQPALVLLDEAFSALDRELRRQLCLDARKTILDLGIPAICVTHHHGEAQVLGDRTITMQDGRVARTMTPHARELGMAS